MAFADRELLTEGPHRSTALGGRQKFPSETILSASISGDWLATTRLSRRFSSSITRILATSLTSMPPNLTFHVYNVFVLTPYLRHRSFAFAPASDSLMMPTIWASPNRHLCIWDDSLRRLGVCPPRFYATNSEKIAANSNETGDPPMRTSRYSDEQIAAALRQAEAGTPVAEVIRKLGIS